LNVQADNALGTLASVNIVAQECLQMLKPHIWPFIGADMSFDLSSKGAVYKQTVDTRRRNIPLVLDHGNDNDGAYQYSDATAIDAACTLSQWPYIQFKFGAGTVAATTRDLKREFMEPLMIGYGEALFKSWTGVMTVANFDKTAILNRQGYVLGATPNRSSLVGIDNDGDTLNWPKGARRIAIMATDAYNQMRNDPYLISYMYAGPESEARRTGDIGERENVMPYKSQFLNARADGVRGFAQIASATLVVGRVPVTPESAFGLAFPGLRNVITEPDSGASMLLTVWIAQDGSLVGIRGEGLLGANVGDPNAGELLF